MLACAKEIAPIAMKNAGPSCIQLGYCPEGDKSCGRKPALNKIMAKYYDNEN
jgi:thymidylate synthase (FAD)